ncbi:RNA 2',3'-cyclic phosphodiesterase [Aestuariibacter sp. AA17]|uniref:RNA 2',3'-cyclic phosphodiesterase n=1 Tax=Fluctibacter corallii TaxID=2984329 RepID=A0ABT3A6V5_9ALTE|nr:RNA 2',3'-cyclic phosphodiesterase [Aestuariibacter sp. AA17]MCV2884345.1 RNA 2',3'-cyclic phosphodiesterase [Aestuariibacter sp. AA17]
MRCFLGLDLSPQTKLAIEQWRDKALPVTRSQIPACNFHITSVFLGDVSMPVLDAICSEVDHLSLPKAEILLNEMGYWSKPRVTFLTSTSPSSELTHIATKLSHIAKRLSVRVEDRRYIPHVTIQRKASHAPPAPIIAPDFTCQFDAIHLFESCSTEKGVRYPILKTWPLV